MPSFRSYLLKEAKSTVDRKLLVQFKRVGGSFDCGDNKLTSLQGAPQEVGEDFSCSYNKLTSLEGAPQEVGGDFHCSDNAVQFTEDDVREVCKVKGKIYV